MYTNANEHPGMGASIVHTAACRLLGLADELSARGGRAGIYLFRGSACQGLQARGWNTGGWFRGRNRKAVDISSVTRYQGQGYFMYVQLCHMASGAHTV